MKRLKITSLLLSVVMCVTMAFPSIGVIADEAAEPTETQTEATEKKPETKAPEKKQTTKAPEKKQEPTEPKKEDPTEPEKKQEPTEPKKEDPTEPEKKQEPTEPEKEEPTEPEKQEPTEPKKEDPTEPEKQEPTEPEKEEPTEPEKQEPTEPEKEEPTEPENQEPTEPKKEDPTEPENKEPTETETQAPSETDKQAPEETEPEATEVPGGKVTKKPKNAVGFTNVKLDPTSGILTWDAVPNADFYFVVVREDKYDENDEEGYFFDENVWNFEKDEERKIDVHKLIRNFIKCGYIDKTKNNVYYVYIAAYRYTTGEYDDGDWEELCTPYETTHKYETNVKRVNEGTISASIDKSGVLKWKPYSKAVNYTVYYAGLDIETTATSFDLKKAIDNAIVSRKIWKDSFYIVKVLAWDSDDVCLGIKYLTYYYKSSATPKKLASLPGAELNSDILTWNSYSGANLYYVRIVCKDFNYTFSPDYTSPRSVNIKNVIHDLIEYEGEIDEFSDYTLELYAVYRADDDETDDVLLAEYETGFHYKEANTLSVSGKTAKVKKNKVRRKKQKVKVSKVIKFKNRGQGKITYSKASGSKKISINGKTGQVTVKKKTKKGTYKVSVWVTASGNSKYAYTKKKVTFKIKVK